MTKGKGTEERREAKSRAFSPSDPTSFPGFCPTRPYGAREGQVGENSGNEVVSRLPLRANFRQERDDWVQGSFFLLKGVALHDLIDLEVLQRRRRQREPQKSIRLKRTMSSQK